MPGDGASFTIVSQSLFEGIETTYLFAARVWFYPSHVILKTEEEGEGVGWMRQPPHGEAHRTVAYRMLLAILVKDHTLLAFRNLQVSFPEPCAD